MLGQGACNQAAEHVANDERAGLRSATRRPTRTAASTGSGSSALAKETAALCRTARSRSSSMSKRRCSFVMPEGPAAEPRRAPRRQDSNSVAGTGQASAGAWASTSGLSASTGSWGLRLGSRSSASVASSPAASGSAVSERLAAESSPRWTSASARAALRSTSASAGARARPADASSGWEASRRSVSHSPRLNASARRWSSRGSMRDCPGSR